MTRTAPAAIYFLSAALSDGTTATVSREGDNYVIRGGFGEEVHDVGMTWALGSPDEDLASYVGDAEYKLTGRFTY